MNDPDFYKTKEITLKDNNVVEVEYKTLHQPAKLESEKGIIVNIETNEFLNGSDIISNSDQKSKRNPDVYKQTDIGRFLKIVKRK